MNLWDFLARASLRHPDRQAVTGDGHSITYGELRARSDRLASALAGTGLRKGMRAGILLQNCTDYIEIIFAVLKVGAVCVPLNYRLSTDEIAGLVRHAGPALLFYGKELEGKAPFGTLNADRLIAVGSGHNRQGSGYEHLMATGSLRRLELPAGMDDPACIMYTAGTTGDPKGVMLTHGNLIWNTLNYTAAWDISLREKELAPTPLFHSSTFGRVFTYIFNGMTFVLCRHYDPEHCLELIQNERITSITQAPTMYHMMLGAAGSGVWDTRSVTRVVTGASTMPPHMKQQLKNLFPRAGFFDLYGLTEASPGVSILSPDDFIAKADSVGRPLLSVEVRVCGEDGRPLPDESVGEIVCRGPTIMQGYYKNQEATARTLHNGWLHTGDAGWCDREGYLYISGRRKEIIISGGVNIYPGEIEGVLVQHPDVDDSAVFGVADEKWGEKAVAALVLRRGSRPSDEVLLDFCRKRLAGFKCPREFFIVDTIPRNAARKVLKHELQRRYGAELHGDE